MKTLCTICLQMGEWLCHQGWAPTSINGVSQLPCAANPGSFEQDGSLIPSHFKNSLMRHWKWEGLWQPILTMWHVTHQTIRLGQSNYLIGCEQHAPNLEPIMQTWHEACWTKVLNQQLMILGSLNGWKQSWLLIKWPAHLPSLGGPVLLGGIGGVSRKEEYMTLETS
jgi:hypothetical protein